MDVRRPETLPSKCVYHIFLSQQKQKKDGILHSLTDKMYNVDVEGGCIALCFSSIVTDRPSRNSSGMLPDTKRLSGRRRKRESADVGDFEALIYRSSLQEATQHTGPAVAMV